jgi:uncharacterized membrane protein YfcA
MDLSLLGLIALYLAAGAVAGLNTGFLGGGGGIIIVPILIYTFAALGYPKEASVHTAVGTSLFIIFFNAVTSSLIHLKKGIIDKKLLSVMTAFGVIGSAAGGIASALTAGPVFKRILAVFLLLVAARFFTAARKRAKEQDESPPEGDRAGGEERTHRHSARMLVSCGIIGLLSGFVASFFGIGGAAITLPLGVVLAGFSMIETICYSTCLMAVCTLMGAAVQLVAGLGTPEAVPYSIGYVNYVAGITMALGGTYASGWAARRVHSIRQSILVRIVAVVVVIAAVGLLF